MVKNYINFLQFVLFFVVLSVLPSKISAQCAGSDVQKIICDIENPSYKNLSLFSLLGGSPIPGGTWSDDNKLRGLDPATGILDAQLITSGGTYHYTYTAPATAGCLNDKAVITLVIGAYAGVGSQATVCSESGSFNLFNAFDGTVMGPHSNGRWTNSSGQYVTSSLSVGKVDQKTTLQFTYTVPPVLECSATAKSVDVLVTILRRPQTGTASNLTLCGTTGLAGYTDLDLNDLLTGEDAGGEWEGLGLTSVTDHKINLQDVFNTYGAHEYTYKYTVLAVPDNNICQDRTIPVTITLEKRLDFTGAKVVVSKDICESDIPSATYSAEITQGPDFIPDGEYNVSFSVVGPISGSQTVKANFVNGVLNFPIRSSYFQRVGKFTITITNIVSTSSRNSCVNIFSPFATDLTIYPLPRLDGGTLTTSPICQNEAATIQINAAQLLDGDYSITYIINGDNSATAQTADLTATGGKGTFEIPGNLNVKSGLSVITILNIINITNPAPQCSNTANVVGNLYVNPLPNVTAVKIAVDDNCFNEQFTAKVSGLGNLTAAKLSYVLSDSNVSALQTVDLAIVNGNASFSVPPGLLLNSGSTTISASGLTNTTTGCTSALNISDVFLVNALPVAPVAGNQPFCKVDRATIANLTPHGNQYKWYISDASTTALADTYLLKSEDYYLREFSAAGCKSPSTKITVVVNDTPAPILNPDGKDFCGLKNPTISDLSKVTNVASTVAWYDAVDNGNLLTSSTLLVDKQTYFGFDLSGTTNCISENYLEVTVSLLDCDTSEYKFFIPDGFSPNGDNVNDTFRIPDIEFLYPDYTLEIFNRYGNVMFKGNKNKSDWDGKNSEAAGFGDGIAPNGVYFYIINFNKDNRKAQQGRLYLNR
ncbi:gliding motility-associated C-terminal domain-containing protein [Flavobacterium sp. FlaQc-57]|uniref:gliding motility-associated C-terminal domain-containing protein n=1 Tax=Flavobacterium sp. FlaQc-57 TaxID=3374186 RepID=UPI0037564A64